MVINKYPITSNSGVKYEIMIEERLSSNRTKKIYVTVFSCSKGFLGRRKKKWLCRYDISEYMFQKEYGRDYVKLVQKVVESGEATYYKPIEELKKWDGQC